MSPRISLEAEVVGADLLKSLAQPLFRTNTPTPDYVYAGSCCGRTSLLLNPPVACGKCGQPVAEVWRVDLQGNVETEKR